jgi:hypothetical protein
VKFPEYLPKLYVRREGELKSKREIRKEHTEGGFTSQALKHCSLELALA